MKPPSTAPRNPVTDQALVRGGLEADLPELLDLLRTAWPNETSDHFLNDPWFEPDQFRVVEVNGRIVSMVKIHKRPIVWGTSGAIVGGIGDVVTHPMHRRRGYAAAALRDACQYMQMYGYDLSLLFTGLLSIYQKLGWAVMSRPSFVIDLGGCWPGPSGRYRVRPFDPTADLAPVADLYRSENATRWGTVIRSLAYWKAQLAWKREDFKAFLVAETGSGVVGYVRGEPTSEEYQVTECACRPGCEDAYLDILTILMHTAQTLGGQRLSVLAPADSSLLKELRRHGVAVHARHLNTMMGRVINGPALAQRAGIRDSCDIQDLITGDLPFYFWQQDNF